MGENRKKVNAVLRKVAQNLERANKRAVTCPNRACRTRIEAWWLYCALCGKEIGVPFACPPDEETAS